MDNSSVSAQTGRGMSGRQGETCTNSPLARKHPTRSLRWRSRDNNGYPESMKPTPDAEQYEAWMKVGNTYYAEGRTKDAEEAWAIAEAYRPPTQVPR